MSGSDRIMTLSLAFGLLVMATLTAAARDSHRVKRILVLGDSLSDGLILPRSQAYPALLSEKLREEKLEFEVINDSVSGGTTRGGLQRLPKHLGKPIDILILELGINDALRAQPISTIRDNIQKMIDLTRKRWPQVRVVLAGMQLPGYNADDYISEFGRMYSDLAERNNAALVPYLLAGVAGNRGLNLGDGIHPNAEGQKILAENVWAVLKPVAREVAAR